MIDDRGIDAKAIESGFSTSFSPTTISGGSGTSTMTVTTPGSGAGNLSVTVNGSSGSLSHNGSAVLSIQDFTLTVSPSSSPSSPLNLPLGQSVTFTVTAAGLNGYATAINLSLTVAGFTYASGSVNSAVVSPGSSVNLYVVASSTNPLESYNYTVTGQSQAGGASHTAATGSLLVSTSANFGFTLPVNQGTLTATPTTQAAIVVFTPQLSIVSSFCGEIQFQVTGLPAGVALTDPEVYLCNNGPLNPPITLTVPPGTPQGNYPFSIEAFGSNGNSGTGSVIYIYPYLQVGAGGSTFSISTSPPQTTAPGGTAQYTVTVSGSAGLGNVTLTTTGGPPGSTVLLNGASSASVAVGGTATMTVATSSNTGLGSYPVSITGMLGTVPQYATALTNIAQAAPA